MRALALLIEYEGTQYAGWQYQQNAITVQEVLEQALERALGQPVSVVGSGRTDAGVHARGQVVHLHLDNNAHPIPTAKLAVAVNPLLPPDIRIRSAQDVLPAFHARFDAIEREYVYRIRIQPTLFDRAYAWMPTRPFSIETFIEAGSWFEGVHDFTAFSKYNPDRRSHECNLTLCRVEQHKHVLLVRLRANRFMYGMCRAITGAMMMAAQNMLRRDDVLTAFAAGNRDLRLTLAPPEGLFLNRVRYALPVFKDEDYL